MDADQAGALFHQLVKLLQPILLQHGMTGTAIAIKHDRVGVLQSLWILGPLVENLNRKHTRRLLQATFEQEATRPVLVLARAMARSACDQNDLLIFSPRSQANR